MMQLRSYLAVADLQAGDRFRFHYYPTDRLSAEIFVYLGNGWYRDPQGNRWRTGRRSAVRLAD